MSENPEGFRTPVDAVTVELVKGTVRAIHREMGAVLERTARSQVIREKQDYFVGLFDHAGRMVQGTNMPLGANILDAIFEAYPVASMRPDDVYCYNDPYASRGGVSHAPDLCMVMPVFDGGRAVAFAEAWGHVQDIGGTAAGSMSHAATEIFQEALLIPPVRLAREGAWNDELYRMILRNSRFPELLRGDMRALVGACRLASGRLGEMIARFGAERLTAAFEISAGQTQEHLDRALRRIVPEGRHNGFAAVDGDASNDRGYTVRVALIREGDQFDLDLTESDDQAPGNINFIMDRSVPQLMLAQYLLAQEPALLMNDGCLRVVRDVGIRPGSILAPRFPAPVGSRATVFTQVNSAVMSALAEATGGAAPAASPRWVMCAFRWPEPAVGRMRYALDGVAVGYGARPFADGIDAVYYIGQKDIPVEMTEMEFPFRIQRYAIRPDSGGPGRFRGGCGVIREWQSLADGVLVRHTMDNVRFPPPGVGGGQCGRPGRFVVRPRHGEAWEAPTKGDGLVLNTGDVLRVETCGGGGWGDPFTRPLDEVQRDVWAGAASNEGARRDYGVAVLRDGELDLEETAVLRSRMAGETARAHGS